jgi:LysM repeat protein
LGIALLLCAALLGAACTDKEDGGGGGTSKITVQDFAFSSQLDQSGQPTNAALAFPAGTRQVNAVIILNGVKAGDKITARWYQLRVANAGAQGAEVNSSVSTIGENVQDGKARIALSQSAPNGLPVDTWLLRLFDDKGGLIRTLGFVVGGTAASAAAPAPSPAAPTVENYTVAQGDTLNSIALKFKPANEDVNAYIARIVALNSNLTPTSTLTPGQVLRVPR